MNDGASRNLAEAILVMHQRKEDGGGCHCGWNVLGASWATHVAKVLDQAGALR